MRQARWMDAVPGRCCFSTQMGGGAIRLKKVKWGKRYSCPG